MKKLLLDVEARSRCDLTKAGARRYAVDPSTQITTACWKWTGERVVHSACNIPGLAHLGNSTMASFTAAIAEADRIVAHNIACDASVIFSTIGPCGLDLSKLDDTMARAQRAALPGGLDALCGALGVQGKSMDGHRLVMATCKPRKDGTFNEDPALFKALLDYNVQDVRCLESVDRMLPPLSPDELEIWRRTWRKNARGLPLDIELCERIAAKRAEIELEIANDLRGLTGGAVTAITQRARIQEWCKSKGVPIPNLQRATVESWLDMEAMPFDVYQVLTILFDSGGSAPTKAQALLDRHVAGTFQDATRYYGARSGRGTSEGANLFNLVRPSGKHDATQVIERLKAEPDGKFTNTELSDVLRGVVRAPVGKLLIDADLANIELRISLWLAGDSKKLELLRNGADLYAATAANALNIPGLTKKTHPKERQMFKSVVLGGGYGVGVDKLFNAFKTNKDLPYEVRRDLTHSQVAAIHAGYRDANAPLQMMWKGLGEAMRASLAYRGAIVPACGGKVGFFWRKDEDVMDLTLPSGRKILHYKPRINEEGELTFWRAKHGRMMEQRTWGGALTEILSQSIARDVIVAVERAIEAELPDVHLILDIYDSVVALSPENVAHERMGQIVEIMRRVPDWAPGLPLDAEATVTERMEK